MTAQRNQIQFNTFGVFLRGSVNPILSGNDISINLVGLRATEKTAPVVYNNLVEANEAQGLEALGSTGILLLAVAIAVQKFLFPLLKADPPALTGKDWVFQGFMTGALWFISWTVLLSATVPA